MVGLNRMFTGGTIWILTHGQMRVGAHVPDFRKMALGGFNARWLWVANEYPFWSPSKWKQGLKPAVPGALILTHTQVADGRGMVIRAPTPKEHT